MNLKVHVIQSRLVDQILCFVATFACCLVVNLYPQGGYYNFIMKDLSSNHNPFSFVKIFVIGNRFCPMTIDVTSQKQKFTLELILYLFQWKVILQGERKEYEVVSLCGRDPSYPIIFQSEDIGHVFMCFFFMKSHLSVDVLINIQ